jgi:hypothetical protein
MLKIQISFGNQAGNQARMLLTQISLGFNLVLTQLVLLLKFLWSVCWLGATMLKNSNFFGTSVGYWSKLMLINPTFIGNECWFQATNAYNSNFLVRSVGSGAINRANNSNFFGRRAGQEATNASFRHLLVIK